MTKESLSQKDFPRLEWVESPEGIVEIYANSAHITWTLDDLRIRLAQLVTSPDTRTPVAGGKYVAIAEERAAVTLTWRNAKLFRDQLTQAIDRFEKVNGEINTDIKLPMEA